MKHIIAASLATAHRLLGQYLQDDANLGQVAAIGELLASCFNDGHKVMVAGNGGSMADALHFAEEWTGRYRKERRPYPVMALGESTHLTCVGNDYGFDRVFERMVIAFGQPGDLLFLLSTSGNSPNLVLAAESARERGIPVVGFLGRGGGRLLPLCDARVLVPGDTSDRIQELHMLLLHILIEAVEESLGHS
jgi:D-sedoheptulose 7-phosphate isomerase